MITLEDFTTMACGSEVAGLGALVECPRCGRPGLAEQLADGAPCVVHVEREEVLGDGMRLEPEEWCRLD
jgi:hypothetical protein